MAGPKKWTEELIAERQKAGRGQGVGRDYTPWLTVQEVSSRGVKSRIPSVKLGRTVHVLSYLERALFLLCEFQQNFFDFNEQLPIPREVTLGAASALRIRHPRYPKTGVPVVMTLDAVLTTTNEHGELHKVAWDVKPHRSLETPRVLSKLSLHRAYCKHIGIEHRLFTEQSASKSVIHNIDLVRGSLPRAGEVISQADLFSTYLELLVDEMHSSRVKPPVVDFCRSFDRRRNLEPGSGLRLFYIAVWQRRVSVDMNAERLEREPIPTGNGWRRLAHPRRMEFAA